MVLRAACNHDPVACLNAIGLNLGDDGFLKSNNFSTHLRTVTTHGRFNTEISQHLIGPGKCLT